MRVGGKLSVAAGLGFAALLALSAVWLDDYQALILGEVGIVVIIGVGLNVLIGLSGQISIGQVAFQAIGAYAVALVTARAPSLFWPALALGVGIAALCGFLLALPAMRLKGPYLAMITIAFAFVVEHGIIVGKTLTGGANGIALGAGVPLPWGEAEVQAQAALIVLVAAASVLAYAALARSRLGLALAAVRDSETAASAIGLNPVALKCVAFAIAAGLAGLAGGFFAPLVGFINPETFPLSASILDVLAVMLGGTGAVLGPVFGAVVVVLLPEMLAGLAEYRLLFVGGLLLIVLLIAPSGIAGVIARLGPRRGARAMPDGPALDLAAFLGLGAGGGGLAAETLALAFGGLRAVDGFSAQFRPGAITALIGPNGAGKSTVLNLLSGFYRADAGRILLAGKAISRLGARKRARRGLARGFQTVLLFDGLSALDNVRVALPRTRWRGVAPDEIARRLLARVGYDGDAAARAGSLGPRARRQVEIARALALRPRVLLLDEPAAGLTAAERVPLTRLLRDIAGAGVAVVLVEHDLGLVMGLSDQVVVLDQGRVIAAGRPDAVQADETVRAAYLGRKKTTPAAPRDAPARRRPVMLDVTGLAAGYGGAPVVEDISFTVAAGETLAILGANGAAKSTLLATIVGLLPPLAGSVAFEGATVTGLSAAALAARGLVLVPEGRQVFPELSVRDNLRLGAFARRAWPDDDELGAVFARFPRLAERARQRAGLLSGGEQQMLAIARGLLARPRLLMLDEPSLGLAPQVAERLFADLATLASEGLTMVVVDQMATLALGIADRAIVIENGRITRAGKAADLADDRDLAAAYLGGAAAGRRAAFVA